MFQRNLLPPSSAQMDEAGPSETSVHFYQTTRRQITEACNFQSLCHKNLKYNYFRLLMEKNCSGNTSWSMATKINRVLLGWQL